MERTNLSPGWPFSRLDWVGGGEWRQIEAGGDSLIGCFSCGYVDVDDEMNRLKVELHRLSVRVKLLLGLLQIWAVTAIK